MSDLKTPLTINQVQSTYLPSRATRDALVKTPANQAAYTAQVVVPEADFVNAIQKKAERLSFNAANSKTMESRNKILRGITVKPETYATLDVIDPKNSSQGTEAKTSFEEFLLQSVTESTEERYQLVETFGEPIGFFFGSKPKIYSYTGVLLNTTDARWKDIWKERYETEFKGTACIASKKRAYLTYDFVLREGYLLGMNISQNASLPNQVEFNFSMYITREMNLDPNTAYKSTVDAANKSIEQTRQAAIVLAGKAEAAAKTPQEKAVASATKKALEVPAKKNVNQSQAALAANPIKTGWSDRTKTASYSTPSDFKHLSDKVKASQYSSDEVKDDLRLAREQAVENEILAEESREAYKRGDHLDDPNVSPGAVGPGSSDEYVNEFGVTVKRRVNTTPKLDPNY